MHRGIDWSATTTVRACWRAVDFSRAARVLAALLLPDSAPASKRPLDWRNNLAAHPHPAPTQAHEWLQRCSLPTPRFRKSIESHRAGMGLSLLVGQASRRARTRRGGRGAKAKAKARQRQRQRHSALAKYARRGTSQSLHIPPLLHLALPSYILDAHHFFLRIPQFRNFFWFPRRDFLTATKQTTFRSINSTFSPLLSTPQEVRLISLCACADLVDLITSTSKSYHLSLPCPLCGVLFCLDVSFFA
ncbi:hypothetical protein BGZ57DRAFT_525422 [Hyaloscypha finlandica]|nr:hypothetical protein BGZ57DRAFT_525422 [Hyaloscypha finlandica]